MRLRNIPEAEKIVRESAWVLPYPMHTAASSYYSAEKPLELEIGMGKGAFLLEMAARHPERNFLGIERYESVLLRAVQKMDALKEAGSAPENLKFLCADATVLPECIPEGGAEKIYLNFSDPWPKARYAKRRLTSPRFLAVYEKILRKDGLIEFKTDNRALFDYSVETAEEAENWEILGITYNLHREGDPVPGAEENIMTEYERKFSNLGSKICKMTLRFTGAEA